VVKPDRFPMAECAHASYQRSTRSALKVFLSARRAVSFLEPEVDRAGMGVLEQPTPVGSALGAERV
jgi:hypothetical protein